MYLQSSSLIDTGIWFIPDTLTNESSSSDPLTIAVKDSDACSVTLSLIILISIVMAVVLAGNNISLDIEMKSEPL